MKSETERMEVIGIQNNIGHQKNSFYTKAIEELFFIHKRTFHWTVF